MISSAFSIASLRSSACVLALDLLGCGGTVGADWLLYLGTADRALFHPLLPLRLDRRLGDSLTYPSGGVACRLFAPLTSLLALRSLFRL